MQAVPVSARRTFALFPLFGFSSTHCQVGPVLAIGLWSTTRIVVVEGVQRHIEEDWLRRRCNEGDEELPDHVGMRWCWLRCVLAFIPAHRETLSTIALPSPFPVMLTAFNALTLSPRSRVCC